MDEWSYFSSEPVTWFFYLFTELHGVTSQKIQIMILVAKAIRTYNLINPI
jgi:hypothetical protein